MVTHKLSLLRGKGFDMMIFGALDARHLRRMPAHPPQHA
jgi:hypothetical protein